MRKASRIALVCGGSTVAAIGIVALMTWLTMPRVSGTLTVGDDPVQRRFEATCESGATRGFYGVRIHALDVTWDAATVVVDPIRGTSVKIEEPTLPSPIILERGDCKTFDVAIAEGSWTVNRVKELEGHLSLDCNKGGHTVYGQLEFSHCH